MSVISFSPSRFGEKFRIDLSHKASKPPFPIQRNSWLEYMYNTYLSDSEKKKFIEMEDLKQAYNAQYLLNNPKASDQIVVDKKMNDIMNAISARATEIHAIFNRMTFLSGPLRLAEISSRMSEKSKDILIQVNQLIMEFNKKYQAKNPDQKDRNVAVCQDLLDDELKNLKRKINDKFMEWQVAHDGPPSTRTSKGD